jgi:branched-chain amino acid transport system ATP-binding protein
MTWRNALDDGAASAVGPAHVEVVDLSVQYGEVTALRPVSVTIEPGTVLAVLGPNGAGKTSLANALSGVIPSEAAAVKIDGVDFRSRPAYARARLGVGHLPDSRAIFPSLTVEENLKMGFHTDRANSRADTAAAYELFPNLSRRKRVTAGKLSGGEQQMLALARLLVRPPRLLIADELSHGLAPGVVANLFKLLEGLKGTSTIIIVEQFVTRALALADTVLVLSHGDVMHFGPAATFSPDQAAEFYSLQPAREG